LRALCSKRADAVVQVGDGWQTLALDVTRRGSAEISIQSENVSDLVFGDAFKLDIEASGDHAGVVDGVKSWPCCRTPLRLPDP